jgi:hypothetical protein
MPGNRKDRRAAKAPDGSRSDAASPEQIDAPFSPQRAFVVQFRTGSGKLTGRAEHMASGAAAFFSDLDELGQFFNRVLRISVRARKPRHRD